MSPRPTSEGRQGPEPENTDLYSSASAPPRWLGGSFWSYPLQGWSCGKDPPTLGLSQPTPTPCWSWGPGVPTCMHGLSHVNNARARTNSTLCQIPKTQFKYIANISECFSVLSLRFCKVAVNETLNACLATTTTPCKRKEAFAREGWGRTSGSFVSSQKNKFI